MTTDNKIPKSLAEAVLRLEKLGETRHWTTFAMTGKQRRYNAMRALKSRGWIEDANEAARIRYAKGLVTHTPLADRPMAKYPWRWRLTDAGRKAAELAKQQYKFK